MEKRRKFFIYRVVKLIANIILLPAYLFYRLETIFLKTEEPFVGTSQLLSLIPGLFGNIIRSCFYEKALKKFGRNSSVFFGSIITHCTAQVGENVFIATNCTIGAANIGNNCLISANVDILSGRRQHGHSDSSKPMNEQGSDIQMVNIGDDTWIGNSSIIMANVGKHCIIGAGSVVVKDVPDYSVAVGNPARVIKNRMEDATTGIKEAE